MTDAPPDRSHVLTERVNPATGNLHRMSAIECVRAINREDRVVAEAVARADGAIAGLIEASEPGFAKDGRLIYLGAGTSGRLGVLDASEAPPTFHVELGKVVGIIAGGDGALRVSSESKEDDPQGARVELERLNLTDRDTLIGIAAGGTTHYVRGAFALARSIAPRITTGMITCTPIDPPDCCDHLIVLETGPEVIAGSTRMKAGTATKLALNTISTTLMIRTGRVYGNLMVDLRPTNDKLRDRAARVIMQLTGLERDDALTLLRASGDHVKTAVVMHRRSVDAETARRLLKDGDGRLERVIGEPGSASCG